MQRSDEGTIQISENAMLRLSKQKPPRPDNEVTLEPGETVVHQAEIRRMLEEAFQKGQKSVVAKLQAEQEILVQNQKQGEEQRQILHQQQLEQLAQFWKEEFEKETAKVRDITLEDNKAFELMQTELTEKEKELMSEVQILSREKEMLDNIRQSLSVEKESLTAKVESLSAEKLTLSEEKQILDGVKQTLDVEKKSLDAQKETLDVAKVNLGEVQLDLSQEKQILDEERKQLSAEKSVVDMEKSSLESRQKEIDGQIKEREQELQAEFEKIATDVESKLRPLQQTSMCTDMEKVVLDCYRQNRKQPLRCAAEVKQFVGCVQAARVKMMQQSLFKGS